MSHPRLKQELVENGLRRAFGTLRAAAKAGAQWSFALPARGAGQGFAALEDDWLVLSAPVPASSPVRAAFEREGHWSLAVGNSELGGGSKLRLVDGRQALHLRNEIRVDGGRRAAAVIDGGCLLFAEGVATLIDRAGNRYPESGAAVVDAIPEGVTGLKDMAAAEGWQLEERTSGDLVHNLDLDRRGAYQIRLRAEPDGHLRAWSSLLSERELAPESRRALGLLLARANDQLRLVRGAVYRNQGQESVHFEVVQRTPDGPEQIKLMLTALTAACWNCGPEVRLLDGQDVAQRYLKSFGAAQMMNSL